jgi:hypothetical protein
MGNGLLYQKVLREKRVSSIKSNLRHLSQKLRKVDLVIKDNLTYL